MKATGKPAQVHFAYQQIADEIEAQILRGDLNPGDQLPGEAELAGQFGVTRSKGCASWKATVWCIARHRDGWKLRCRRRIS